MRDDENDALVCGRHLQSARARGSRERRRWGSTARISIAVTEAGFEPNHISVARDENVVLVFTRKVERTCVKKVVVYLDDERTVERDLPLNRAVEIPIRF